jgi:hypothetical protein
MLQGIKENVERKREKLKERGKEELLGNQRVVFEVTK